MSCALGRGSERRDPAGCRRRRAQRGRKGRRRRVCACRHARLERRRARLDRRLADRRQRQGISLADPRRQLRRRFSQRHPRRGAGALRQRHAGIARHRLRWVRLAGSGQFRYMPSLMTVMQGSRGAGDERSAKSLHQDLWLPDERLRFRAYGGRAGAATAMRAAERAGRRRPGPPQHLPHPREGGREGLFRARPAARAEGAARGRGPRHEDRRRRLRRAGRGRGDPARARRRSTSWSGRRAYHRLPELLAARRPATGASSTPNFPAEDKFDAPAAGARPAPRAAASAPSSPCRKAATSSAPSASCPIRAAPSSRGRSAQIVAEAERLVGARREGDHAARAERQRLSRRRPGRRHVGARASCSRGWRRSTGIERLRYTTSHPRDMGDDLIAAHRDLPKLMPYLHLPVQSGSDRILAAMNRRHDRDDLSAAGRAAARGAARHRALRRLHRRLSRRDAKRISPTRCGWSRRSATPAPIRSNTRPRPGTPAADDADQVPEAVKAERLQRLQALLDDAADGASMPRMLGRDRRRAARAAGQAAGPARRPLALAAGGARRRAGDRADRRSIVATRSGSIDAASRSNSPRSGSVVAERGDAMLDVARTSSSSHGAEPLALKAARV